MDVCTTVLWKELDKSQWPWWKHSFDERNSKTNKQKKKLAKSKVMGPGKRVFLFSKLPGAQESMSGKDSISVAAEADFV